jgi:type I restriction-modification system DNA methylase subunit
MGFFQTTVIEKHLKTLNKQVLSSAYANFKAHFHNPTIQENIRNSKEEQYQGEFLIDLFVNILGYTKNPTPNFNLTTEYKNIKDSKKADGAILLPSPFGRVREGSEGSVIAVIELKGTDTTDLSKVEPQAFNYKNNQPDCIYVIISNFEKLRLYIDNAIDHIEFNLFTLTEKEFELLYLCLAYDNIEKGIPKKIKEESLSQEDVITKKLYNDYSLFKRELNQSLVALNPQFDALTLFKKSQKLLDRFLFLFFAEDRQLLPPNSVRLILDQWRQLQELDEPIPLYNRFKKYFEYLNEGHKGKKYDVFAYNGGLFKPDEILDTIKIDDELLYKHTKNIAEYDFDSEVDVHILGHIFENSLNELDEIKAQLEGQEVDKTKTKRKKDGIFYTPKYITKYIVDNTIGKLCTEKKTELQILEEEYTSDKRIQKKTKQELVDKLTKYRNWLLQLTICDPACGSGAFLNQALDFLINEHKYIDELQAKIFGHSIILSDIEKGILENNLFGVDINEESVEIAKLSLWLRTAQPNRTLNDLNNNIKCGNSLIDDPAVAGEKAFNWHASFPKVFEKGGFDVVIGNPPWGAKLNSYEVGYLIKKYSLIPSKISDTYLFFSLLYINLCKSKGYFGIIIPNTWLLINNAMKFREFILSFKIDIIIDHGDSVFNDAIVESTTLILQNDKLQDQYCQTIREKSGNQLSKNLIDKSIWYSDELKRIVIDVDSSANQIIKKIESISERFDKNCEIIFGIKPYQVGLGIPKQTQENVDNRIYHSTTKLGDEWFPLVTGTDVNRYSLVFNNDAYIKYGKWLMYFSNETKINNSKLLLRRTSSDLRLVFDDEKYYPQNSLFIITSTHYNLKFLLTILNSKLFAFIYKNKCPQIGKIFAEVKPSIIKSLPIKNITISHQQSFIIKSELMLSLNKELQEISQKYQRSLQRKFELKDLPPKLQNWHLLSYADFIKELGKKKIEFTLAQEAEWEEYFLQESKKAQELKSKIIQTDKEIDQMVYKLYDLTDEEIAIVENSTK